MSFEISFHLRFHVIGDLTVWSVVGFSLFRALRPISGGMEGRLSLFGGLLRAPYGANNQHQHQHKPRQLVHTMKKILIMALESGE